MIKNSVIPPGVNETVFNQKASAIDIQQTSSLDAISGLSEKPVVLVSSRLDKKRILMG